MLFPSGDFWQGVQPDFTCSEPTSMGLSAPGAACFYGFLTYLQGTVRRGYRPFVMLRTFFQGDCKSGLHYVNKVSEPTSRELSA